jgi:hypothetical protein
MKRLALLALVWLSPLPALAGATGVITNTAAVCDPNSPFRCIAPDASGNVPVTFGGGTSSVATVGGIDKQIATQLTVQNAAYSASNAIGGTQTVALFRTAGNGAKINTAMVQSKGGSTTGMTLYGVTRSPSWTCTDKVAFAESASDVLYRIPGFPIVLTPGTAQGSTTTYASAPIYQTLQNLDSTPGTNAYFCLVVNGSVTPASTSDLILTFGVVQD